LKARRWDVVHSHVHLFSGAILTLARLGGVPVRIAHSHTSVDDKAHHPLRGAYRAAMKGLLRLGATHQLAASHAAGAALFGGGRGPGYEVLHYGIDVSAFRVPRRACLRKELGIPLDAVVVGHVGRMVEAKNQEFLLHVWREVVRLEPSSRLVMVGDGPLRPRLEELALTLGLSGTVMFLGTRGDVPSLLSNAFDGFVLPSLWEGLPLATVEAQAAALPVLVSERVSAEIVVVPSLVRHLSLAEGPRIWAEVLLRHVRAPRPSPGRVLEALDGSDFDADVAGTRLKEYYARALGEGAH
jgi:glycosyltransferase involved in cell wall biosynthesis